MIESRKQQTPPVEPDEVRKPPQVQNPRPLAPRGDPEETETGAREAERQIDARAQ